jgi:hypothetical protein
MPQKLALLPLQVFETEIVSNKQFADISLKWDIETNRILIGETSNGANLARLFRGRCGHGWTMWTVYSSPKSALACQRNLHLCRYTRYRR